MRKALSVLVLLLGLTPAAARDVDLVDWLAIFVVASDKCAGQRYDIKKLEMILDIYALSHDWSERQTKLEAKARTISQFESYRSNPEAFCATAKAGRRTLGRVLKEAGAIR